MTTTEDISTLSISARIPVTAKAINKKTGSVSAFLEYNRRIRHAHLSVVNAAKPDQVLDPLTIELVRLRNAALQGCRFCGSFRSGAAQEMGMNEPMVDAIYGDYQDSDLLSEKHKVAMRLVDAFILGFGHVDEDLARQAHEHFSDAELAAIGLKVVSTSINKISIALGTDYRDPKEVYGLRNLEQYFPDYQ